MRTDLDLWELIKANDEQAFSELFYRYSSKIYSKAYTLIKDREICEQIVHDIFLTLWAGRKTLAIRSFKAYLTAASRYQVYKHLSSSKKAILDYKDNLEELSVKTVHNTGHDNITYKELEEELESYLSSLPGRCREIFIMSRRQLFSNDEIAQKLNISKRSVENQITYALKHLRISLKDISVILAILTYIFIDWGSALKIRKRNKKNDGEQWIKFDQETGTPIFEFDEEVSMLGKLIEAYKEEPEESGQEEWLFFIVANLIGHHNAIIA